MLEDFLIKLKFIWSKGRYMIPNINVYLRLFVCIFIILGPSPGTYSEGISH